MQGHAAHALDLLRSFREALRLGEDASNSSADQLDPSGIAPSLHRADFAELTGRCHSYHEDRKLWTPKSNGFADG
jgi:hypothetical protein